MNSTALQAPLLNVAGNRPLDSTELAELQDVAVLLQTAKTPHQVQEAARRFTEITDRLRTERAHSLLERVLDFILDHLPLRDVVTVGHTSRALRDAFLHSARGVLSGSTVLAFILGCNWGNQDLDIYVPRGPPGRRDASCFLKMVQEYLVGVEGYKVVLVQGVHDFRAQDALAALPQVAQPALETDWQFPQLAMETSDEEEGFGFEYDCAKVRTVVKLSRPGLDPAKPVEIDIVEGTDSTSPIVPITRFHTTFVMNFISSSTITLFYPRLTFAMEGVLNERIDITRPKQQHWMEKYRARGFKIITTPNTMKTSCGSACRSIWRTTEDKGCMRVLFDDPELALALPNSTMTTCNNADNAFTA
ncbi:hypothetical protein FRC04_002404 [Tulasnella sp. 424]|nr:hypothetical protein FRC04_002404 [Tulasnella sp. 424]KAG8968378.1 hypothetical protein FRC05_001602 [Tulasnella sp. 425]